MMAASRSTKSTTKSLEHVRVNRESNRMVDSIAGAKLSKDEIRILARIVEELRPKQKMRKRAEMRSTNHGEVILTFRYTDLAPQDYKRTDCVIKALNSLRKREANTFSDHVDIVDGWISRARHFKREGKVEIVIGEELLPDYIALGDGYTEYMRETVFSLKSKYAIHIYKLLARNRDYKYFKLHISHLRKYLNLEPEQYSTIKDFKRRILLPAFEELKNGADIYFETDFNKPYREGENELGQLKKGRKVVGYRIKIIDRKAKVRELKKREGYLHNFIVSYFEYVGMSQKDEITKKTIRSFCEEYGTDDVIMKLTEIKGYVKKSAKKKGAYITSVLKKHFIDGQGQKSSREGLLRGQAKSTSSGSPTSIADLLSQIPTNDQ